MSDCRFPSLLQVRLWSDDVELVALCYVTLGWSRKYNRRLGRVHVTRKRGPLLGVATAHHNGDNGGTAQNKKPATHGCSPPGSIHERVPQNSLSCLCPVSL